MSHEVGKWRKAGRFRVVLQKCTDPPQESIGAGRELQGLVRALDAGEHDTVDSIAHLSCRRQCKMGAVTDAPEVQFGGADLLTQDRSEEHTSELQSLMRISYAVFCLKKKKKH